MTNWRDEIMTIKESYSVEVPGYRNKVDFELIGLEAFAYGNGTGVSVRVNGEFIDVIDTRYHKGILTKEGFKGFCEDWLHAWFGEEAKIAKIPLYPK